MEARCADIIVGASWGKRREDAAWADAQAYFNDSVVKSALQYCGGEVEHVEQELCGKVLGLALFCPGALWESPLAAPWNQQEQLSSRTSGRHD